MDFLSCIITVSENFRLMKRTMRTVNFRALSSITHVNAFTVNFRIYHLFLSKVSSVLGNFILFFSLQLQLVSKFNAPQSETNRAFQQGVWTHNKCCCFDLLNLQQVLFRAGELKWGTDEEKFITILGTRSVSHLRRGRQYGSCVLENFCLKSQYYPAGGRNDRKVGFGTAFVKPRHL